MGQWRRLGFPRHEFASFCFLDPSMQFVARHASHLDYIPIYKCGAPPDSIPKAHLLVFLLGNE